MLKVSGLETGYGRVRILRGIDLEVGSGQIVALLGGNGTGKSTLLRAVSGLLPTWKGSIEFDGEVIHRLRPDQIVRRGLVQVTQGKDSYPAMTVEENLMLGAHIRVGRREIADDLKRIYGFFPRLRERRSQMSGTLSGGEVQMLVIGRGLMARPRLIMLDEPSAALAPKVVLDIFVAINRIRDAGVTVLIVEQNVRMALLLAEYGYIIRDGLILMEGEAQGLLANPNVKSSFLGGTVAGSERDELVH
ncbi:MAG: ABC transporter ATP-binding protein [Alphaproteobacteria bacterium]|nr:ABC transporter ATP-binding protein [Alphaproteobacteria bacterium]